MDLIRDLSQIAGLTACSLYLPNDCNPHAYIIEMALNG